MSAVLKDTADFANSAGHWYDSNTGEARYTLIGANGKERATTVRDAKKLGNLVPSVTTILRQAAAPGLERWKIGNAIMSALTLTRQEGESDEAYIDRILRDSNEQAAKARDRGTEIHGAIEKWYTGIGMANWVEWAESAGFAVEGWAGRQEWSAERSFASPLGYGGKLDLSAPGFVADFKTTDKPLEGLKLWPEHRRQLAAYRHGLDMPQARCAIVYVSATEPAARVIELSEDELQQGWNEFKALLAFYYHANRMELPNAQA